MSKGGGQTRQCRSESGQEVLEWSGLLVLVLAIFTMMFALGIPGKVGRTVVCAVDQILHAGLCSPGPAYPVNVTTKTVGYQGRVTFVDAGHQYVVTLTRMSDGSAQISLVNTGTLGVSARAGAQVELGPLGGAEAQAQAGGGVYLNGSTTWTFPDWATAQKYWRKISSGDSAGLAVNDAARSVPLFGAPLAGLFNDITGDQGAPSQGSISSKYLSATAVGGGVQGSAGAGAGADLGPYGADIKTSLSAQGGLEHINSGPEKGDWQGSIRLSADGDGSLGDTLFGPHASGIGSVDGEVTVTFGSDFTPQTLEVRASGDGVWEAVPSSTGVPDGSVHGGTSPKSGQGGESGGAGEGGRSEPLLEASHTSAGGEGVGSTFVGTLDLTHDPTAQAALDQVLEGNYSQVSVLIDEMNAHGSEYIQSYRLKKSSSTWGGEVNLGGGGGGELNDGSSSACYDPPRVRQNGGSWTTATYDPSLGC